MEPATGRLCPLPGLPVEIIADALTASGLVAPVILDLGCGPGSLGDRLAARLPGAEIVGLDYDPVLLSLARVLHVDDPDRSWIELDMRRHDWVEYLEGRQFDAVVSTTALHWLGAPNLMRVYQDLTKVLAPGGVFVNGDICSYDQTQPTLRRMAAASIKANRAWRRPRAPMIGSAGGRASRKSRS